MTGLEEKVTISFLRTECHSEAESKMQIYTIVKSNYFGGRVTHVVMVLPYLNKAFNLSGLWV